MERRTRLTLDGGGRPYRQLEVLLEVHPAQVDLASAVIMGEAGGGWGALRLRRAMGDMRGGTALLEGLAGDALETVDSLAATADGRRRLGLLAAEVRRLFAQSVAAARALVEASSGRAGGEWHWLDAAERAALLSPCSYPLPMMAGPPPPPPPAALTHAHGAAAAEARRQGLGPSFAGALPVDAYLPSHAQAGLEAAAPPPGMLPRRLPGHPIPPAHRHTSGFAAAGPSSPAAHLLPATAVMPGVGPAVQPASAQAQYPTAAVANVRGSSMNLSCQAVQRSYAGSPRIADLFGGGPEGAAAGRATQASAASASPGRVFDAGAGPPTAPTNR